MTTLTQTPMQGDRATTIYERSRPGRRAATLPAAGVPEPPLDELIPARLLRRRPAELPEVSEPEIVRQAPARFDRDGHALVKPAGQGPSARAGEEGEMYDLVSQNGLDRIVRVRGHAPGKDDDVGGAEGLADDPAGRLFRPGIVLGNEHDAHDRGQREAGSQQHRFERLGIHAREAARGAAQ